MLLYDKTRKNNKLLCSAWVRMNFIYHIIDVVNFVKADCQHYCSQAGRHTHRQTNDTYDLN